jgi:hypothetical protein
MQQQTIKTNLISTPTISVPANFTALHLAHVAWDLYSSEAPTHFSGEFTIHDGGDFAMYNIEDSKLVSDHFYECAFAIANYVQQDSNYSIQEAFELIDDLPADTCVRENTSHMLVEAIEQLVNNSKYNEYSSYIAEDYVYLTEEQTASVNAQIQKLETQLAQLKATQQ